VFIECRESNAQKGVQDLTGEAMKWQTRSECVSERALTWFLAFFATSLG
jgi:hypothetical protein